VGEHFVRQLKFNRRWLAPAVLLFAGWSVSLARVWPNTPRATFHYSDEVWLRCISPDSSVLITDWIHTGVNPDSGTDYWDLNRGVRVPSPFAGAPEWESPSMPDGSETVRWNPERLAKFREWYERDLLPLFRRAQRAARPDEEPRDFFPHDAEFSPSGRQFFYPVNAEYRPAAEAGDAQASADYFRLGAESWSGSRRARCLLRPGLDYMLHDTETGRKLGVLRDTRPPLAFSPDGRHALTWSNRPPDERIYELVVRDLRSGREQGRIRDQWDAATIVFLTQDSDTLVEFDAGPDSTIKLFEWWKQTGDRSVSLQGSWYPRAIQSPRYFCVHRSENKFFGHCVWVWDVTSGHRVGVWEPKWPRQMKQFAQLSTSADGGVIAVECQQRPPPHPFQSWPWLQRQWEAMNPPPSDEYRLVTVIDATILAEIVTVAGRDPRLTADGRRLVTMDASGKALVWDLPPRPPWVSVLLAAVIMTLASQFVVLATLKLGCLLVRRLRREVVAWNAGA
jgi:hypothetical protein